MGTLSYFTVDIAECKEGYVFVKHGHYLSIHSGLEHLTDITSYYLVQIYNIYLHIQRSGASSRYHFVLSCIDIQHLSIYIQRSGASCIYHFLLSCIDIQHLSIYIAVWSIQQISLRFILYRYLVSIYLYIYSGLEHLVDITSYYLVQIYNIYLYNIAVWSIQQISLRIILYRYKVSIYMYSGLKNLADITSYYLSRYLVFIYIYSSTLGYV